MSVQDDTAASTRAPGRRAWSPEVDDEVAALLRRLASQPWLVAGRDDDAIAAVRRNQGAIRVVLGRLGWVLVVERDLVRLRKSPPPRLSAWATRAPNPLTCAWFFLLVAAAESVPPRVGLAQLVTAARAAAAEAGVPTTGAIDERRAIVAALKELDARGVIERKDGEVDTFVTNESAPVLLAVHHTRLVHVIANTGAGDPSIDPPGWLAGVQREPDAARRMRRRLVDDALVHGCDLDDAEADWLRRRVKGDDGEPLAKTFGMVVERRAEGAAFVVPDEAYRYPTELGPNAFPVSGGTIPHAALLLCDAAALHGALASDASLPAPGPGPGWRGLRHEDVVTRLTEWATGIGAGRGGWAAELVADPALLARRIGDLLTARDLLRIQLPGTPSTAVGDPAHQSAATDDPGTGSMWWFSPATGRWPAPPAAAAPAATNTSDRAREDPREDTQVPESSAGMPDLFDDLEDALA